MKTIAEALFTHASEEGHADRLCVADSSRAFTYAGLCARVFAFAKELRGSCRKGAYVLIRCTQDADYVTAVLAVQTAGLIAVPVESAATKERVAQIAKETGDAYYIGPDEAPEGCSHLAFPEEEARGQAFDAATPSEAFHAHFTLSPSDVAEILFTTGSTGKSKGILITHANNLAVAENIMYGLEMKENNIELIPMPLSHSHGLRTLYANLLRGGAVVLTDGILKTKQFFSLLEEYRVTALDLSPAILSGLVKLSKDRLGNYRDQIDYVELGSAPLSDEGKETLIRLLPGSRLYNFYGSTESGRTCTYDFNHNRRPFGCIGKPSRNATFLFVDEKRVPVNATKDSPGFIATGGAQNMPAYFNAPELTASVMQDGFIYTTDLGYRDAEGFIYCLGRQDFVINRGGMKISPEEIEEVAMRFSGIKDCACVPAPDAVQGQVPVLFLTPADDAGDAVESALMTFLKEGLDVTRLPKRLVITAEIPRAENGKILRAELMERL